jgi:hypothetical protein
MVILVLLHVFPAPPTAFVRRGGDKVLENMDELRVKWGESPG